MAAMVSFGFRLPSFRMPGYGDAGAWDLRWGGAAGVRHHGRRVHRVRDGAPAGSRRGRHRSADWGAGEDRVSRAMPAG